MYEQSDKDKILSDSTTAQNRVIMCQEKMGLLPKRVTNQQGVVVTVQAARVISQLTADEERELKGLQNSLDKLVDDYKNFVPREQLLKQLDAEKQHNKDIESDYAALLLVNEDLRAENMRLSQLLNSKQ